MNHETWPAFSFTEAIRPEDGWRVDSAVLSTYSADLNVVATALLALSGVEVDGRRKGNRVELVKAIETLQGKVRVLAQAGRLVVPHRSRSILKTLDRFLRTMDFDERHGSWHPKAAFVRYRHMGDVMEQQQWRVWLGSRNLTQARNWEAGMLLTGRLDGKGRPIEGLDAVILELTRRAKLTSLSTETIRAELAKLSWVCPTGCEIHRIDLFGPGFKTGFPHPPKKVDRLFVVSPFLDAQTIASVAQWGDSQTHRTIVSTTWQLRRLSEKKSKLLSGFREVLVGPAPDLPGVGCNVGETESESAEEVAESEDPPPAGLHAKLLLTDCGSNRRLWIGSANITERAWEGRNFEIVAELSVTKAVMDGIKSFVDECERFKPDAKTTDEDADEELLEDARKGLSGRWSLRQQVENGQLVVLASAPPPLPNRRLRLEVAPFGGAWHIWNPDVTCLVIPDIQPAERSDLLQVRVSKGGKSCAWLQTAPCEPSPDVERDRAVIARYLDVRTFFLWLQSLLSDGAVPDGGGDWDGDDDDKTKPPNRGSPRPKDHECAIAVEDILHAWAKDPTTFQATHEKVGAYLNELERAAREQKRTDEVEVLQGFRKLWTALAVELL